MLNSRGPGPDSLTWKNMVVRHSKITSQELLTDPNCAPESTQSVSNLFPLLGLALMSVTRLLL